MKITVLFPSSETLDLDCQCIPRESDLIVLAGQVFKVASVTHRFDKDDKFKLQAHKIVVELQHREEAA